MMGRREDVGREMWGWGGKEKMGRRHEECREVVKECSGGLAATASQKATHIRQSGL